MRQELEIQNRFNLNILCICMFLPALVQFLNVLINNMNMGIASTVTTSIYIGAFLYMLFGASRRGIFLLQDIKFLFLLFMFLGFNYFMFSSTRKYFFEKDMLIVLGIYIPICVISIRKISDFTPFVDIMKPYAVVTALISGILLLFLNYQKFLVYMEFSYALLPMGCASFWLFVKNNDKIAGISSLVLLIEMLCFGARAPILYYVLFCVLTLFLLPDISKGKKQFLTCIGIMLVVFAYSRFYSIISELSGLSFFSNSRFITKATSGNLFTSQGRDMVYEICRERLDTMGLYIGGFFGDRPYCEGLVYPHSIVYEILMSWGWIIGGCLLIWLLCKIIKAFIASRSERLMLIFAVLTLLARYFVSGSYLIEGKFWVFLTVMLVLSRRNIFREQDYSG